MDHARPVFYVSDGTGITAETIGHSMLTQFSGIRFQTDRLPFVDTPDKARQVAERIRLAGESSGLRPIVVNSSVDTGLSAVLAESGALMLDVFAPFIAPLEQVLGQAQVVQPQDVVDRSGGAQDRLQCVGKRRDCAEAAILQSSSRTLATET